MGESDVGRRMRKGRPGASRSEETRESRSHYIRALAYRIIPGMVPAKAGVDVSQFMDRKVKAETAKANRLATSDHAQGDRQAPKAKSPVPFPKR